MLKTFIIILSLAIVWIIFTQVINPINIVAAIILAYLLYRFFGLYSKSERRKIKILKILNLISFFIGELIIANFKVAIEVIKPKFTMTPAIIAVPLDISKPYELVIFTSLITLTPGSLTLHFSDDNKIVYIHTLYYTTPDEFRAYIKNGFEKKIIEAF